MLNSWRDSERRRLLAAREALASSVLEAHRRAVDTHLARAFPRLATATLAFCWPIRNEYDARPLASTLRRSGCVTALPVIVEPRAPLAFREWYPSVELARGPLGIPYPVGSREVIPGVVILPLLGWDGQGYRLGYGGGYFDRTLAALSPRPLTIGVGWEASRLPTLYPQVWDVPMDYVVTERGVYRRADAGLGEAD